MLEMVSSFLKGGSSNTTEIALSTFRQLRTWAMTTVAVFARHNEIVRAERGERPPGTLLAGHYHFLSAESQLRAGSPRASDND